MGARVTKEKKIHYADKMNVQPLVLRGLIPMQIRWKTL